MSSKIRKQNTPADLRASITSSLQKSSSMKPYTSRPTAAQLIKESREWLNYATTNKPPTPTNAKMRSLLDRLRPTDEMTGRPLSSMRLAEMNGQTSISSKFTYGANSKQFTGRKRIDKNASVKNGQGKDKRKVQGSGDSSFKNRDSLNNDFTICGSSVTPCRIGFDHQTRSVSLVGVGSRLSDTRQLETKRDSSQMVRNRNPKPVSPYYQSGYVPIKSQVTSTPSPTASITPTHSRTHDYAPCNSPIPRIDSSIGIMSESEEQSIATDDVAIESAVTAPSQPSQSLSSHKLLDWFDRLKTIALLDDQEDQQEEEPQGDSTSTDDPSTTNRLLSSTQEALVCQISSAIYIELAAQDVVETDANNQLNCLLNKSSIDELIDNVALIYPKCSSPSSQLILVRMALQLRPSGTSFAHVCQLTYQIGKNPENDRLFVTTPDMIDIILSAIERNSINLVQHQDQHSFSSQLNMTNRTNQDDGDDPFWKLDGLLLMTGLLKFLATTDQSTFSQLFAGVTNTEAVDVVCRLFTTVLQEIDYMGSVDFLDDVHPGERLFVICIQLTELLCQLCTTTPFDDNHQQNDPMANQLPSPDPLDQVIDCLIKTTNLLKTTQANSQPSRACLLHVSFNACRLVARLTESLHEEEEEEEEEESNERCCHQRVDELSKAVFEQLLLVQGRYPELILRAAYALGNLATWSSEVGRSLFTVNSERRNQFYTLLRHHLAKLSSLTTPKVDRAIMVSPDHVRDQNVEAEEDRAPSVASQQSTLAETGGNINTEIVVKMVRLLANSSVDQETGLVLCSDVECIKLLLSVLEQASGTSLAWSTELLMTCLTALNNLTYHAQQCQEDCWTCLDELGLGQKLTSLLTDPCLNSTGVVKSVTRILGNLTRDRRMYNCIFSSQDKVELARQLMENQFGDTIDSDQDGVLYTTIGVLVNLATDPDLVDQFEELGLISRLTNIVRTTRASRDWRLAGLVCQVGCNYLATRIEQEMPSKVGPSEKTVESLLELKCEIKASLGETWSLSNNSSSNHSIDTTRDIDFKPFASDLMNWINRFLNDN